MTDSGIEDNRQRHKQDLEIADHQKEEEELEALIQENIGHKRNIWPGLEIEDTSPFNLLCFLINLIIFPTGYTFFLKQRETQDGLICRRHLQERARQILQTIDKAQAHMGGKSSKQDSEGSKIENQVGVETSYSLLDFRNWHSSSIGILIILVIIILATLFCTSKRYLRLHQEVQLHRSNHQLLKEKGHQLEMTNSDDHQPIGQFLALTRTDTIISSKSLQRLRIAAAARGNQTD